MGDADALETSLLLDDALPAAATCEKVEGIDGAYVIDNVLTPAECQRFVRVTEELGYDNATHPEYQNAKIDKTELRTRRNDRCVTKATPAEEKALWSRIVHASAATRDAEMTIDADEYGTWREWGLNDLWRFYKYSTANHLFPVHKDNTTVKSRTFMSWTTVLVYLTDRFEGGSTNFHKDPFSDGHQGILPRAGRVLLFRHTGDKGVWHSGSPVCNGAKYILRTDIMYSAVAAPPRALPLSAPYDDDSDEDYTPPR